jgi:hypothetical protein
MARRPVWSPSRNPSPSTFNHEIIMKRPAFINYQPATIIYPLTLFFYLLPALCCLAQPQPAWVARYNGGFTNQSHVPLTMKLDNEGNIYVAGSSQNASNLYDYAVLKYAPNGTQRYAARYSSTNGMNLTINGFVLDQSGDTYCTGTGGTVKFDPNGQLAWAAPYAGNDVAVDTNGNVYVTGFSAAEYATVKLSSTGSNLWMRTYVGTTGPGNPVGVSQKVAVDDAGNIYVAGWTDYGPAYHPTEGQPNWVYYSQQQILMYDTLGNPVWTNAAYWMPTWGYTIALIPNNCGNLYTTVHEAGGEGGTARINMGGHEEWDQGAGPIAGIKGMAIDSNGNAFLTGGPYAVFQLNATNGQVVWYINPSSGQANGIALDNSANVYVTGISNVGASGNDWKTVKYDNNGNQQWAIFYNGPANGNDGATAIAVAPDGSIYVTGYSASPNGGSDITTIKYANLTNIQKKSDGSIQLQFFGNPGQSYSLQATTDFLNWTSLGSSLADTNGLFEFLDSNAPLFPNRFYRHSLP